jgi:glycosyltransferase involved in cell wall biosynthesis
VSKSKNILNHRNIILVNQVTGPMFIDIANEYVKKYSKVTLLTGAIEPTYNKLNKQISVVSQIPYNRSNLLLRIITWIIFTIQSFLFILKQKNNPNLLLSTNPPFLPILSNYFGDFSQIKLLIYDIYPNILSKYGYINEKSFVYKYWSKQNIKVFNYVNEIITISNSMAKILGDYTEYKNIKIISPWVNTSYIRPINRNHNWFTKKFKLEDKIVILYSGNMGKTHSLFPLVEAAKQLNGKREEFHFLFIGDGSGKKELVDFVDINRLNNVLFLPYQSRQVLPFSFSTASYGVVSQSEGLESMSLPSKTFYYLAAGNAIISISSKGSELYRLVQENKCGITIHPKNGYKDLVEQLIKIDNQLLFGYQKQSRILSHQYSNSNVSQFI